MEFVILELLTEEMIVLWIQHHYTASPILNYDSQKYSRVGGLILVIEVKGWGYHLGNFSTDCFKFLFVFWVINLGHYEKRDIPTEKLLLCCLHFLPP